MAHAYICKITRGWYDDWNWARAKVFRNPNHITHTSPHIIIMFIYICRKHLASHSPHQTHTDCTTDQQSVTRFDFWSWTPAIVYVMKWTNTVIGWVAVSEKTHSRIFSLQKVWRDHNYYICLIKMYIHGLCMAFVSDASRSHPTQPTPYVDIFTVSMLKQISSRFIELNWIVRS